MHTNYHTPWAIAPRRPPEVIIGQETCWAAGEIIIIDARGVEIATLHLSTHPALRRFDNPHEWEAYAKHLVACVNNWEGQKSPLNAESEQEDGQKT